MITLDKIRHHLNNFDLDIRKTHNARFMDQKVTPDVLSLIADCVINLIGDDLEKEFTVRDIWESQYLNKNVKSIFNKPDIQNPLASSEYDKFIGQPLKMLSYANILVCEKRGDRNYFKIINYDILVFISDRVRNSFVFLYEYLIKVLSDSNVLKYFDRFRDDCNSGLMNQVKFKELKEKFQIFIIGNTSITGTTEVNRIFPKILNIIATENVIRGTIKGRLSQYTFYYTDLLYNRVNWRDVEKDKNLTRTDALKLRDDEFIEPTSAYSDYLVQRAIKKIRAKYRESELRDQYAVGEASVVHHIFPKHQFLSISWYLENLIKLTPTQHTSYAHPNGNTRLIDKDYQLNCLLAKSVSIESSLVKGEFFYSKESFIHVINTGLSISLTTTMDFKTIKRNLTTIYNNI